MIGVLIIQGLFLPENRFSMDHFTGNLLVLCAAACESFFNILSRFFVHSSDSRNMNPLHPIEQTAIVSAIAMLLCLIPAVFESPLIRLASIGMKEWFVLLWYGIFVTALAFIFWYAGIKRCNAVTAASFSGIMPFTSLLLSVLLLGESAGPRLLSGGALVIAGIVLIGISTEKQAEKIKQVQETGSTKNARNDTKEKQMDEV